MKIEKLQSKIEKKIKNFIEPEGPPFREWFLPIMIIVVMAPLVFIWLTAGYGVSYNINTGKLDLYDPDIGPNEVNPMDIYPPEMYFFLAVGYFSACIILCYFIFQYYLKRWELWLKYEYQQEN